MPYIKPLYIAVNPVASKFAKALQSALKLLVKNKVYRVDHHRAGQKIAQNHKVLWITPQPHNKIVQYNLFKEHGISCPNFTTDKALVSSLGSKTVFARTLINSTNGRGIVEFNADSADIPDAPLYTAYIPKKKEFRVHVFNGEVISYAEKRKKTSFEGARNTRVRNSSNGYVYCRNDVLLDEECSSLAIAAVASLGYSYGAVDIIYNEKQNLYYVLEVNSRPGLEGQTLQHYAQAFVKTFELEQK